ncbi:MAG: hypothetical protein C4348_00110 [Patescibacteria group bacterium]
MRKIIFFVLFFLLIFNFAFGATITPGEVKVTWTKTTISVCPPGIFGTAPKDDSCAFIPLLELIATIWKFILDISPIILTILIIIGGFYFLLIWLKPDFRDVGWRYIKEAILGYVILLIISGIFTFIRAIIGGP